VLSAFHTPPVGVKMAMDAVCVLLGIAPSWKASRKLLGDCNTLTQKLITYDKDNVDVSLFMCIIHLFYLSRQIALTGSFLLHMVTDQDVFFSGS